MRSWNLHEIEVEGGSRSPVVLDSDDAARAVLIVLEPGQSLGDHQVKEHAYVLVVDGNARVDSGGSSRRCFTTSATSSMYGLSQSSSK